MVKAKEKPQKKRKDTHPATKISTNSEVAAVLSQLEAVVTVKEVDRRATKAFLGELYVQELS